MIQSIRHKGLKALFYDGVKSGINPKYEKKLNAILFYLNNVTSENDFKPPVFGLHKLTGNLQDFWSLKVSANYRVIFRFDGKDVWDLDLVDYHNK